MLEHDALLHYGVMGMRWGVRKDRPPRTSNDINREYFEKEAARSLKRAARLRSKGKLDQALHNEERAALAIKRSQGAKLTAHDRIIKNRIYNQKMSQARIATYAAVPISLAVPGAGVAAALAALAFTTNADRYQTRKIVFDK